MSDWLITRKERKFIEKLELDEYGEVSSNASINWKRIRVALWWLGLIPLILLAIYSIYKIPELAIADSLLNLTENERLQRLNEVRSTVVQTIGGLILLVGIFFTWRNIRATERNLQISQESTSKNLEIAHEGLITQRFSKAVELLGSDKVDVRLGGIYALERIARESKKDHWPIVEILTAFVRVNSARATTVASKRISSDIQAVLTVLGRRNKEHEFIGIRRELSESRTLDLSGTNLHGADLYGANLSGANLSNVDLTASRMLGTNLEYALLNDSDLSDSKITGSNFRGTELNGTRFRRARLTEVKFDLKVRDGNGKKPTDFSDADIKVCSFRGTNLLASTFDGAKFLGGSFVGAKLTDADFTGATFHTMNLKEVDLTAVKGLKMEQINSHDIEYDLAKLPPDLRELLEKETTNSQSIAPN